MLLCRAQHFLLCRHLRALLAVSLSTPDANWSAPLHLQTFSHLPVLSSTSTCYTTAMTPTAVEILGYLHLLDNTGDFAASRFEPLTTDRPYFVADRAYTVLGFHPANQPMPMNYKNLQMRPGD